MNAVPDMPPGGADLQGGRDESRNAEVAQLKRLFYSDDESESQASASESLRQQGFLADVPIARWKSQPFLPHQQVLLNIFQPEYTHMFESLLASPQPWYYMHLHLPGGIENLANPEYALPDGVTPSESASLGARHGTLMRVVSFKRLPDARLRIVVQGLGRAIVVRGTQQLPFARGDVQLLPDTEALLDAACTSRAWLLEEAKRRAVEATDASDDDDGTSCDEGKRRRRTVLAAAAAEEAWWRDYEHAAYELTDGSVPPPAFCSFDPAQAARAVAGATDAVHEALHEALAPAEAEEALRGEASEEVASALFEAVVMTPLDEAEEEAAEEAAERAVSLQTLELQVWLELDAVLRSIAHLAGDPDAMPAPVQLLGLIPPAPAGGWPDDFALLRVATQLRAAEAAKSATDAETLVIGGSASDMLGYDPGEAEPFEPVDAGYPARRRAQRLSFSIWQVIANYWAGLELQPVLEVESTSDRLRMSLIRLRALAEQLKGMGAF